MESVYLKTFIEVARTGNITRAADVLCVTQSAVSRRIKFLEERYDKLLLDRSGPVLTPTVAGRLVLEKARKILEIEQELNCGMSSLDARRAFSFACTHSFGAVHLPAVLQQFMLKRPETGDVKIKFDLQANILRGLGEGIYDMAVVEHCESLDLSGFETVELPEDQVVFAGAPGLGLPLSPVPIDMLLRHTLYGRHEGCGSRTLLERNLAVLGREISEFRRLVVFDDPNQIVQALLAGDGIAFVSTDLVRDRLSRGGLCEYRVEGFTHHRKRTFITSGQHFGGSLAEMLCQVLFLQFDISDPLAPDNSFQLCAAGSGCWR